MITDNILELMNLYNDAHGWSREIDDFIEFLKELDEDITNAEKERKEHFVNKYLEIHGRR